MSFVIAVQWLVPTVQGKQHALDWIDARTQAPAVYPQPGSLTNRQNSKKSQFQPSHPVPTKPNFIASTPSFWNCWNATPKDGIGDKKSFWPQRTESSEVNCVLESVVNNPKVSRLTD